MTDAKRPHSAPAGLLRDRRGATAVEMALICPVLLSLILATIEIGRLGWTQAALQFAVEEAARCASIRKDLCSGPAQTASYAATRAAVPQITASAFTVSTETCGLQVRGEVRYAFIVKSLMPVAPRLAAQRCRP
jgi:Flp pilus assembly protein TadG